MPDEDRIRFEIKTYCQKTEDYWISKSLETGLIARGGTHRQAEEENGQDNLALVRWLRDNEGYEVVQQYFEDRGIDHILVDESQVKEDQILYNERQVLFA